MGHGLLGDAQFLREVGLGEVERLESVRGPVEGTGLVIRQRLTIELSLGVSRQRSERPGPGLRAERERQRGKHVQTVQPGRGDRQHHAEPVVYRAAEGKLQRADGLLPAN